jgi:hypothetical protein
MKILANSHSAFSLDVSKLSVNGSSHWRGSNERPEHSGYGFAASGDLGQTICGSVTVSVLWWLVVIISGF